MRTARGSVTVFASCLLMLVLSAVFVFLEAARVSGLAGYAAMDRGQTRNSLLAEYSRPLWESYGILGLDAGYGTGTFDLTLVQNRALHLSDENLQRDRRDTRIDPTGRGGDPFGNPGKETWELYPISLRNMDIKSYQLASDDAGAPFRRQAADGMKKEIGSDLLEALYALVTGKKEEAGQEKNLPQNQQIPSYEFTETDNPLKTVEEMRAKGILRLVMPEDTISGKSMELSGVLSHRKLQVGNWKEESKGGWQERLLFQQYIMKYFGRAGNIKADRTLDYEVEYILNGKKTDEANVKTTVNKLLAIREAANFAFLQKDPVRKAAAETAATVLAMITVQPELIPVFQQSILAAWAYAESVSDVRLLMDGQKVSLVKTEEQWHTDLKNLGKPFSGEQKRGMSYEEYLQMLLWLMRPETVTYRSMDLIEANTGIRMDHMILQMQCCFYYEASVLFPSFMTIGNRSMREYLFTEQSIASYQPEM